MMTKREKLAKNQIYHELCKAGYGRSTNTGNKLTYADLFNLFDLNLTSDPKTVAYVRFDKAIITVNENLDLDQVSFVVRHEILHQFLNHWKRFQKHLMLKQNVKDLNDIKISGLDHKLQNIAADYELSNLGYTEDDKRVAKHLKIGDKVVSGLVTDIDHPEWVNLSMEEIYDKLQEESDEIKEKLMQMLENMPFLDVPGDSEFQDLEDIEREAKVLEETAEDLKKELNDSNFDDTINDENNKSNSENDKDKNSAKGETEKDADDESDDNESSEHKNSNSKNSKKELEKEIKNLEDKANKLRKKAQDLKDKVEDKIEDYEDEPIRSKAEVAEDARIQSNISKLRDILNDEKRKQEIINSTLQKVNSSYLKRSERELQNYNANPLVSLQLELNRLIKRQVISQRETSWSKFNKTYVGTDILRPGVVRRQNKHIPIFNVYFDVSGSVEPFVNDTLRVLDTLNIYVRQKKIKLNLFYVSTILSFHRNESTGGGADGSLILQSIKDTAPDNVLIMTDGDANSGLDKFNTQVLKGGLFYVFPNSSYIPTTLMTKLKALTVEKVFNLK